MTTTLADDVASALLKSWEQLAPYVDSGRTTRRREAVEFVTGIPIAPLNGVWSAGIEADLATTAELLDDVAQTGLPHCLQFRPAAGDAMTELARSRGMALDEEMPLMVLAADRWDAERWQPPSLNLRPLQPGEAALHARAGGLGFGAPVEFFERLITDPYLAVPGVHCYVGESEGEPVTTGLGVEVGSSVGIFNIATVPEHRGKGWGTAVTAKIAAAAFAAGCSHAWLQSSPAGYSVYEKMGFRTLERWPCWVSTPNSGHTA